MVRLSFVSALSGDTVGRVADYLSSRASFRATRVAVPAPSRYILSGHI